MSRADYVPHTPAEVREMLDAIGVSSVEELFSAIPADLRAASFDLPEGLSEMELLRRMRELAAKDERSVIPFVGAGSYDHFIPSVVDHLSGRSEFYTAYTPYQPECSQGTLQALFEYQSAMCALTGMDVSNASLYDGGTALAEGAMMAMRVTGRSRIVVDGGVNPLYRQILATYLQNLEAELVEVPPRQGMCDREGIFAAVNDATAAVLLQNPNFFGTVDDFSDIADRARSLGALVVASVYPVSLGMVKSPGEMGADIVTGDGQSLGNPVGFGGPSFGFITCRKQYVRSMPGRIIGETVDGSGRRGFVLTLQAREQHIRRHRATSNICSNQSLCALRGLLFLSSVGREGFAELARLNYDKAEYAKEVLSSIRDVAVLNVAPTFNEFTLALQREAAPVAKKLLSEGIAAGLPAGIWYPEMGHCLVVTVTEKRTKQEIDLLAGKLGGALWN